MIDFRKVGEAAFRFAQLRDDYVTAQELESALNSKDGLEAIGRAAVAAMIPAATSYKGCEESGVYCSYKCPFQPNCAWATKLDSAWGTGIKPGPNCPAGKKEARP